MPSCVTDLGLGHVAVKAHEQQLLLAFGQLAPVCPHRLHVEHVLELRVLVPEQVGEAAAPSWVVTGESREAAWKASSACRAARTSSS